MIKKILWVEKLCRFKHKRKVERLEGQGIDVLDYSEGKAVIEALKKGLEYDLALVDIPLDDGLEGEYVIQELKAKNSDIPVYLLAGYVDQEELGKADGVLEIHSFKDLEKILKKYMSH